jgi:AcrR family transcriptional regulator
VPRAYRLGRRQPAVDRTATAIVGAARELVSELPSSAVTVSAVARRAGVSRITVYNRFGSREALLDALAPSPPTSLPAPGDAREALRAHVEGCCSRWAASPALFRHLPPASEEAAAHEVRELAGRLAAADALRPGCSLREAEDVIATLTAFAVFDRLHRDGRRSPAAVADVLMRLASGILA